jgi:putative chitinase
MNWTEILTKCGVKKSTAEKWAPAFSELVKPESFSKGFAEIDDFLAQIFHESGMLERLEENLNYKTPENIRKAFGSKRFPTIESATPFVRAPEKLANYSYGGRGGNNRDSDGWNYRGRGLIQLTFKDNYLQMSKYIGLDLVANPDIVAQPYFALKVSIGWWEGNIPDGILDNTKSVTKRVNGGDNGLAHREQLYKTVKGVLAEYL